MIPFSPSPNVKPGGLRSADLLVIHYTAGGTLQSNINWFLNPKSKASAHYIVGRSPSEEVVQTAHLQDAAWHAGESEWKGRRYCNTFSVGIEIVNAGWFNQVDAIGRIYRSDGESRIYYPYDRTDLEPKRMGTCWWEPYSDWQVETVARLYWQAIRPVHPGILPDREHLVGHNEVAPGRKTDPGPAWDWDLFMEVLHDVQPTL